MYPTNTEKIDVIMSTKPIFVFWQGRKIKIEKVGLHHTFYKGKTLFHTFSVASSDMFFKLVLNTKSLSWRLCGFEEYESSF